MSIMCTLCSQECGNETVDSLLYKKKIAHKSETGERF